MDTTYTSNPFVSMISNPLAVGKLIIDARMLPSKKDTGMHADKTTAPSIGSPPLSLLPLR